MGLELNLLTGQLRDIYSTETCPRAVPFYSRREEAGITRQTFMRTREQYEQGYSGPLNRYGDLTIGEVVEAA